MPKGGKSYASVARGKSGGVFSSPPGSTASTGNVPATLASVARGGAAGAGASDGRMGDTSAPSTGDQAVGMKMQSVPAANSQAPGMAPGEGGALAKPMGA